MNSIVKNDESGVTIFELLAVLFIISLISATVVSNIKEINRPLTNATFEVTHFLRLVRARAISQTQYIKVSPTSAFAIASTAGTSCALATSPISDLTLNLPKDTNLVSTSWSICFTPRGLTEASKTFQIRNEDSLTKTVEIALGGGVRIQ